MNSNHIQSTFATLWTELHIHALYYPDTPTQNDQSRTQEWLQHWASKIPDISCRCKDFWAATIRDTPPDLSSSAEFLQWTIAVHDLVNLKLGKELWSAYSLEHAVLKDYLAVRGTKYIKIR